MGYLLYPGCMVTHSFPGYEVSTRKVCEKLGIHLEDLDRFVCCGSSILPCVTDNWINFAAITLAQAEAKDVDILTLCGNCTNNFKRAVQTLNNDGVKRERVNKTLENVGLSYTGDVKIKHLIELLYGMKPEVKDQIKTTVDLRVALTVPCQVYRPGKIANFDTTEKPQSMHEIVSFSGVEIVSYEMEYDCCGSTVLLSDVDIAYEIGANKVSNAIDAGAQAMVVSCGNCSFLLDIHQRTLLKDRVNIGKKLPILFLPQLLGLSLGISSKDLRINRSAGVFDA